MAEQSRFFDAVAGAPEYTAQDFSDVFRALITNGFVATVLGELAVVESTPPAMTVEVQTGRFWIQGRWYENSATKTLTVDAADPTNPRIDRVVVRLDVTNRNVVTVLKKGTAGVSPSPPVLQQDATIWEEPLAQILIGAGVTSIANADITDERTRAGAQNANLVLGYTPVNKAGDTMTGTLIIEEAISAILRTFGDKVIDLEDTAGGRVGRIGRITSSAPARVIIENVISARTLRLLDSGELDYSGDTIWHAGNLTPASHEQVTGTTELTTPSESFVDISGMSLIISLTKTSIVEVFMSMTGGGRTSGTVFAGADFRLLLNGAEVSGSHRTLDVTGASAAQMRITATAHAKAIVELPAGDHTLKAQFARATTSGDAFVRDRVLGAVILAQ